MKIGFIGCGNMAQAMIKGIIETGLYQPEEIMAADHSGEVLERVKNELGIHTKKDNKEVAMSADIIILAVKPFHFPTVIPEIRDYIHKDQVIISIAAGQTMGNIQKLFEKNIRLIRTMPNTPALVLAGATGLCHNSLVSPENLEVALAIFKSFGIVHVVDESMIDAVIGVSGSSPAYVFMFIEAMADAAVADGMPRKMAYEMAAQTVMGSAKMVLETGIHPAELKDMVCSPGGTTIAAVQVLEEKGFRSAVIEAQRSCVNRAKTM